MHVYRLISGFLGTTCLRFCLWSRVLAIRFRNCVRIVFYECLSEALLETLCFMRVWAVRLRSCVCIVFYVDLSCTLLETSFFTRFREVRRRSCVRIVFYEGSGPRPSADPVFYDTSGGLA